MLIFIDENIDVEELLSEEEIPEELLGEAEISESKDREER